MKGEFDRVQRAEDAYSLGNEVDAGEDYFRRTRRIERIEVRNFKVLGELDIRPASVASTIASAPWLMLLGENGCGKSSLLQAVALALMGAEERAALGLDASSYVRNGTKSGLVRVHLAGSQEPIELRFSRSSTEFRGGEEPKLILLAYGATRLLPGPGQQTPPTSSLARVRNLFDPFSPIGNSTDWLLGLDDRTFEAIARALKGLLGLEPDDRLVRNRRARPGRRRGVRPPRPARGPERRLPVGRRARDRPDALAARALAERRRRRGDRADRRARRAPPSALADADRAEPAPGLPARAVPLLDARPALPARARGRRGRGREAGRGRREVVAVTDLPSVAGLRVDQLLTSEHFGMNSTIDPELDALFAEYYLLKAKPHGRAARSGDG